MEYVEKCLITFKIDMKCMQKWNEKIINILNP